MPRLVASLLVLALAPGLARAQAPEDEWSQLPAGVTPTPPPPPPPAYPPLPPPALPGRGTPPPPGSLGVGTAVRRPTRPPEPRNEVSILGAQTLGQWKRAQLFQLGFPLISLRFLLGVGERVDLGVAYDSYYFVMNEPRLVARVAFVQREGFAFGASLEGGYAFFAQRASREVRGARWLTGRRNINISPALHVSYQGPTARAARLFLELRYTLALDTEPFASDPLVGVPADILVGHNGGVRGGAELPLSPKTSFFFAVGLDAHGRPDDSVMMPSLSVGLVTSL
jgi:hypothetical protein